MARKLPKIVTVEGIIGSGKTTLLTRLQQQLPHHKVKFVPEPIESWENAEKFKPMPSHFMKFNETFPTNPFSMNDSNGVNGCANHDQFELLSKMYSDPSRWCLSFQLWALYTRIKSIECALTEESSQDTDLLLIERSSIANRLFAHIMYDNNYLNECEWWIYNHFFDYFNEKSMYALDAILYLNCPVDTAMDRISIRNRKGEVNITNQYQTDLKNKHDEWIKDQLQNDLDMMNRIPVFEIEVPYDKDDDTVTQTFQNIDSFVTNLQTNNRTAHFIPMDINPQIVARKVR
eukprot:178526_1